MTFAWTIKPTALPMCDEDDGAEWPSDNQAALTAWSVFTTRLEFNQPIRDKLEVSTSDLTEAQRSKAVQCIEKRGWDVVVWPDKIVIARPKRQ